MVFVRSGCYYYRLSGEHRTTEKLTTIFCCANKPQGFNRCRARTAHHRIAKKVRFGSRIIRKYEAQEKYSEAEILYLEALEIDRRSLPQNHPNLAIRLNNLALLYKSQEKYSEAELLYLQALEIFRSKLSENHPDIETVWENYVVLWQEGIDRGDLTLDQLQEHPFGEQLLAELQE